MEERLDSSAVGEKQRVSAEAAGEVCAQFV